MPHIMINEFGWYLEHKPRRLRQFAQQTSIARFFLLFEQCGVKYLITSFWDTQYYELKPTLRMDVMLLRKTSPDVFFFFFFFFFFCWNTRLWVQKGVFETLMNIYRRDMTSLSILEARWNSVKYYLKLTITNSALSASILHIHRFLFNCRSKSYWSFKKISVFLAVRYKPNAHTGMWLVVIVQSL